MEVYLYGGLIAIISFLFGTIYMKTKYRKIRSKGTGRFGIIRYNSSYRHFFIELEELEVAGEWTKIRIIDIFQNRSSSESTTTELLKNVGFNEWVRTSEIIWFDNNSQQARERKLNEILG